jgi:hypothetical protein
VAIRVSKQGDCRSSCPSRFVMISDRLTHFWLPHVDEFGQVRRAPHPIGRADRNALEVLDVRTKKQDLAGALPLYLPHEGRMAHRDQHTCVVPSSPR